MFLKMKRREVHVYPIRQWAFVFEESSGINTKNYQISRKRHIKWHENDSLTKNINDPQTVTKPKFSIKIAEKSHNSQKTSFITVAESTKIRWNPLFLFSQPQSPNLHTHTNQTKLAISTNRRTTRPSITTNLCVRVILRSNRDRGLKLRGQTRINILAARFFFSIVKPGSIRIVSATNFFSSDAWTNTLSRARWFFKMWDSRVPNLGNHPGEKRGILSFYGQKVALNSSHFSHLVASSSVVVGARVTAGWSPSPFPTGTSLKTSLTVTGAVVAAGGGQLSAAVNV